MASSLAGLGLATGTNLPVNDVDPTAGPSPSTDGTDSETQRLRVSLGAEQPLVAPLKVPWIPAVIIGIIIMAVLGAVAWGLSSVSRKSANLAMRIKLLEHTARLAARVADAAATLQDKCAFIQALTTSGTELEGATVLLVQNGDTVVARNESMTGAASIVPQSPIVVAEVPEAARLIASVVAEGGGLVQLTDKDYVTVNPRPGSKASIPYLYASVLQSDKSLAVVVLVGAARTTRNAY